MIRSGLHYHMYIRTQLVALFESTESQCVRLPPLFTLVLQRVNAFIRENVHNATQDTRDGHLAYAELMSKLNPALVTSRTRFVT